MFESSNAISLGYALTRLEPDTCLIEHKAKVMFLNINNCMLSKIHRAHGIFKRPENKCGDIESNRSLWKPCDRWHCHSHPFAQGGWCRPWQNVTFDRKTCAGGALLRWCRATAQFGLQLGKRETTAATHQNTLFKMMFHVMFHVMFNRLKTAALNKKPIGHDSQLSSRWVQEAFLMDADLQLAWPWAAAAFGLEPVPETSVKELEEQAGKSLNWKHLHQIIRFMN